MNPEDERLGQLLRLIRHRIAKTQIELAAAAQVPLRDVKRLESGRAGMVLVGRVRAVMEAAGGRVRLVPSWNGAAADALLDERHARIVERGVRYLSGLRTWLTEAEITFSTYGERGSIDILGSDRHAAAVAVCEVKTALGSLEETNRVLDMKTRLAPSIVFDRHGWRPTNVARILILPRSTAIRRVVEAHAATMSSVYPARTRDVHAWLRNPSGPLSGIWFVADGPDRSTVRR
jgi:hypothetical protein